MERLPGIAAGIGSIAASTVGVAHAGATCWLQGLYYVVASVPLGLALIRLARRAPDRRQRTQGAVYGVVATLLLVHAGRRVEAHRAWLDVAERELAPVVETIESYRAAHGLYPETLEGLVAWSATQSRLRPRYEREPGGFRLGFPHNILRTHLYDSTVSGWLDRPATARHSP